MIRKIFAAFVMMGLFSCGQSAEEIERQQRIDDSLMEIERVSIIEWANQLLEEAFDTASIDKGDTAK